MLGAVENVKRKFSTIEQQFSAGTAESRFLGPVTMFACATAGTAEPMAIDRDVDVMLQTTSTCRSVEVLER
jgi:hypothetical protein